MPIRPTNEMATITTNHKTILVKIDVILNFIAPARCARAARRRKR